MQWPRSNVVALYTNRVIIKLLSSSVRMSLQREDTVLKSLTNLSIVGETTVDPDDIGNANLAPGTQFKETSTDNLSFLSNETTEGSVEPESLPTATKFFNNSDAVFQLFVFLFARSIDLKILQLWNKNIDCLACCAVKYGELFFADSKKCDHTAMDRVTKYFDDAILSNEYFFITLMQNVCMNEDFEVPTEEELEIFKQYCRTVYRPTIRNMILNDFAEFDAVWRDYFDI